MTVILNKYMSDMHSKNFIIVCFYYHHHHYYYYKTRIMAINR